MPLLILILIIVLVAQIGFWKTLASILGAIGVVVLLFIILGLLGWATVAYFLARARGR